jgi:hypothetical protein
MTKTAADPVDSHPALVERIAPLEALAPSGEGAYDERPAIELLGDLDLCEEALIRFLARDPDAASLPTIQWHEVASTIYARLWHPQAEALSSVLDDATISSLPEVIRDKGQDVARLVISDVHGVELCDGHKLDDEQLRNILGGPLAACVGSALVRDGWLPFTNVAEPIAFRRDGETFDPFPLVHALLNQRCSADDWRRHVYSHGVQNLRLGKPREV